MSLEERIARMIIGPREPVPENSKFTLEYLRDIRWKNADSQETSNALWAARTIIRELGLV